MTPESPAQAKARSYLCAGIPHPDSALMVNLRAMYLDAPESARADIATAVQAMKDPAGGPLLDRIATLEKWLARHYPQGLRYIVTIPGHAQQLLDAAAAERKGDE